jgi:hypothetical protein
LPGDALRIDAPTPWVWAGVRLETKGARDVDGARWLLDAFTATPVSKWGRRAQPLANIGSEAHAESAVTRVNRLAADEFFRRGVELMSNNAPHFNDWSMVARLRTLGLRSDQPFDVTRLPAPTRTSLEAAPENAQALLQERASTSERVINEWRVSPQACTPGAAYLDRALGVWKGRAGATPSHTLIVLHATHCDGEPLHGDRRYMLRFDASELPPVEGFWSISLYDADGRPVANALDRHVLSTHDDLDYDARGTLDLRVQRATPGQDFESNWLPAPSGAFTLTMRLYAPALGARDGRWSPPRVRRVGYARAGVRGRVTERRTRARHVATAEH